MDKNRKSTFARPAVKAFPLLCFLAAFLLIVFSGSEIGIPADGQMQLEVDAAPALSQELPRFGSKLIPLGRTTGIKMYSEGTMIVGFSKLENCGSSPAEDGGLKVGDVIVELNGEDIKSNEALVSELKALDSDQARFTVLRDGTKREVAVEAIFDGSSGGYRIGAWIRDSIAGIGTITFVDPQTGAFGALGHGICDADTGTLMPFGSGSVMSSKVESVQKGENGKPGQLTGSFELTRDQGLLYCNTNRGVFGVLNDDGLYSGMKAYELAEKSEIKTGRATILSNVSGSQTREYQIEIVRVYDKDNNGRDMMIRVTDPALLETTGGIVQGMSGSPIIQNGKLIGAVTHVLINEPQRGYGISIQNMLCR